MVKSVVRPWAISESGASVIELSVISTNVDSRAGSRSGGRGTRETPDVGKEGTEVRVTVVSDMTRWTVGVATLVLVTVMVRGMGSLGSEGESLDSMTIEGPEAETIRKPAEYTVIAGVLVMNRSV